MARIFKARKNKNHLFKLRYLLFLGLIYLSFDTTYGFLLDKKTSLENEQYLKMALSSANHHFVSGYQPQKFLSQAVALVSNIDLSKPTSLLGIKVDSNNQTTVAAVADSSDYNDTYDPDAQEKVTNYIKDPNPTTVTKPRIYIYNSHQLENYNAQNLEAYNITPNVMMASYMLKEDLNDLGVQTIVNESNIAEFMRISNMDHADSYKASRIFMLDAKNKYDTLEYYIDIHRDAIKKDASTREIGGKSYAKTLFVVGLENPNYAKNLALANELHKRINEKYPGLSRGVIQKQGKGVDGVYNQDVSSKAMLIEVGGYENTIEEVMSTVDALSKVIYGYVEGDS